MDMELGFCRVCSSIRRCTHLTLNRKKLYAIHSFELNYGIYLLLKLVSVSILRVEKFRSLFGISLQKKFAGVSVAVRNFGEQIEEFVTLFLVSIIDL